MIATSISQSKRLLEAGIDPQTADMQWNAILTYHGVEQELFVGEMTPNGLPAWSLSALIKLIYSIQTNQHRFEYIVWDNEGNIEGIFEDCVTYLCKKK